MAGHDAFWIRTFTGKKFYPLDPRFDDIDIEDIAHALGNICRFTGQCNQFYSVAQHSVLASMMVEPAAQLWALLHDASEAYLSDVAGPVKWAQAFDAYRALESRLQAVINVKFGLIGEPPAIVKAIDDVLLQAELRDFMTGAEFRDTPNGAALVPRIEPLDPVKARQLFLMQFKALKAAQAARRSTPAQVVS